MLQESPTDRAYGNQKQFLSKPNPTDESSGGWTTIEVAQSIYELAFKFSSGYSWNSSEGEPITNLAS